MGIAVPSDMRIKEFVLFCCLGYATATVAYDHELAERLVNYAGASYCAGKPSAASWSCYACKMNPGFQNITSVHDKETDGRGIVGYDPVLKARIIAFMGTNLNIKTWIDDIMAEKQENVSSCAKCSVHAGF